jgi:hypothetical protein
MLSFMIITKERMFCGSEKFAKPEALPLGFELLLQETEFASGINIKS